MAGKFATKSTNIATLSFWSQSWKSLPEGGENKAFKGFLYPLGGFYL